MLVGIVGQVEAAVDRTAAGDRNLLALPWPYDWMPEDVAADLLDTGADGSLGALVRTPDTR